MKSTTGFSKRLKELRTSHGFSVSAIAKMINAPISSYQEWEQGRKITNVEIYFLLANALGVTPEFLIFGEEPEEVKESNAMKIDQIIGSLVELKKSLTLGKL